MSKPAHLLAVRLHDEVRDFAIEGVAKLVELADARQRIRSLKQRPVLAAASALPQRPGRSVQIEHGSALRQTLAVRRPQDGAAAGGQHDVGKHDEVGEHRLLAITKAGLALELEDQRYGNAE